MSFIKLEWLLSIVQCSVKCQITARHLKGISFSHRCPIYPEVPSQHVHVGPHKGSIWDAILAPPVLAHMAFSEGSDLQTWRRLITFWAVFWEYGLIAVGPRSIFNHSESYVCILGSKSDPFSVSVGL